MNDVSGHEARISALESERKEIREDFHRLFAKMEEVATSLAVMKSVQHCPDPGACIRLEKSMVDQNRRIALLELADSRRMGERAIIGTVCVFVGSLIGWVINWFSKQPPHS